jgi:ABC-type glycerol-3-phosphate transport system permease component
LLLQKLKRHKSPSSDEIPAELIQAEGEILLSKIHKLINSIWNKEKLPNQWKESIILRVQITVIKLTVVIIVGYHCYQFHTKCYPIFFSQG